MWLEAIHYVCSLPKKLADFEGIERRSDSLVEFSENVRIEFGSVCLKVRLMFKRLVLGERLRKLGVKNTCNLINSLKNRC